MVSLSNFPLRILSPCRSRLLSTFLRHLHSSSYPSTCSDDQPLLKRHLLEPHSSIHGIRNSLRLCRTQDDLLPLKALITVAGLIDDETLIAEFISRCFDLGNPELALSTFRHFPLSPTPSLFLQNLVIKRLYDSGLREQVLPEYRICVSTGFPSDCYTFPFVIKACSTIRALRSGEEVHGVVLRTGYESNVVVQTALLDFYARTGQVHIARKVFDRIPRPDIVSWNALISGFSLNGFVLEALSSLGQIWVNDLKPNVSTLASIIPICSRTGCLDLGKSLHGYATKSGIDLVQLLIPAFISMYACNGDIFSAKTLFDFSPVENDAVWNSMMHSYKENMQSHEVFKTFKQMLCTKLRPNSVSFVSVIPCCENLGSISSGECLHASVIKYGFESHVHVVTSLISMYAKLGKLDLAETLFVSLHHMNLLTCNTMISGYLYNEVWDAALSVVCDMQSAGFVPDVISLIGVLSACSKSANIRVGQSVHTFSIRRGFDAQLNLSNALMAFYSGCNHLDISFKIFQGMKRHDSISWNTLISGCVDNQDTHRIVALLWQMQQEGVKIDLVTMISALPSFKEADDLKYGTCVHGYAIKCGSVSDVSLCNALIIMYSSCGDLNGASSLFDLMPDRDVISWNSLITGYRDWNLVNEALSLLRRMMVAGQKPNYVTLINLVPTCISLLQGKSIHGYAVRAGLISQIPLVTSLLSMYARFENIKSCFSLFQAEDKSNISLWNSMISVLVQVGDVREAVTLFHKLLEAELVADHVTFLSLISACTLLQNINFSNSILSYITKNGFILDKTVSNAVIGLYAKCGDISISKEVFERQSDKDSITWSVMINGYALHGDGKTAYDLFLKMKESGMRPEGITYLSVLSACSHSGLVEHSIMAFNSMLEDGIAPTIEHCGCIMDLLGRTGHLNEAYGLLKKLPCGASTSMLESLLGACAFHGNIEIGEKVGEEILEREFTNSGAIVMLHNIYAGAGRWEDANRVRKYMDNRELRKAPGFSHVEI